MNTNEFYKELMSEYSFDHDKIKKAAMGKSVSRKTSRLKAAWISAAGAAAAIAITFGSVALLNTGSPVSVAPTTSISAEDRFKMAMEAYNRLMKIPRMFSSMLHSRKTKRLRICRRYLQRLITRVISVLRKFTFLTARQ